MEDITVTEPRERPIFLTVLCVIAFIHVGLSIILGLFSTIASGIPSAFRALPYLDDFGGMAATLAGLLFSAIALILAILAFLGIIQMWNMMRIGFWTFSVSMVFFLLAPFAILSFPLKWILYITLPNLIIVPMLIILFAFNYKHMD